MTVGGERGEPTSVDEPRRADARRNIATIVTAAAGVLARDPSASMQDVAEACGLHRATVHRHFASRQDLLVAVREHAFAAAAEERDRALAHADPLVALRSYVSAMLTLGEQYRLYRFVPVIDARNEGVRRSVIAPVADVIVRGREEGVIRGDIDPGELAIALSGLIWSVLPEVALGRLSHASAVELCVRLMRPVAA